MRIVRSGEGSEQSGVRFNRLMKGEGEIILIPSKGGFRMEIWELDHSRERDRLVFECFLPHTALDNLAWHSKAVIKAAFNTK